MTGREMSAADAAALLRPNDTLALPLGPGAPPGLLHALGDRDDWESLEVFGALLLDLYSVFTKPGVRLRSGFFGPAERVLRDSGANIEFIPADFRRFVTIAEQFAPRVMTTAAAPPDADGFMSLSLHAGATVDELHRASRDPDRVVIVEVNEHLPRTRGLPPQFPHGLHVDAVDAIVHDDRPVYVLDDAPPGDVDRAIAEYARAFIADGCTLQTGIGGVPSSIVGILAEGSGGDYGVHSEMFTTGLMRLHESGKVTNARKGEFHGFSVATFALGTTELYAWLDGNDDVRFLPVDVVNAPNVIARNHHVVSINGALAVDLYGQVVADRLHGRQFSGIGGHEDFVAQSGLDLTDRSLICLPSTAVSEGVIVTRIVSTLTPGTTVTSPRHQVDVVITEHGVAELRGRTMRERAVALAEIAHPTFRDELREAAAHISA
ncbi:MAG TPA: acetyl-CoA hydrolase/transferase C-terminal domain-containing protein [Acidimicrobiia bacterium]|nr:acetyl-CoA hydrolase/transferase C-terminal domain-containing protein [Acidimicrobiia bacterium]